MAGKFSKFLSYIGIVENDDLDEEVEYDSEDDATFGRARDNGENDDRGFVYNRNRRDSRSDDVEETFPAERNQRKEAKPKMSAPTISSGNMKMIVYNPTGYEDTQNIIDCLKGGRPVVVNICEVENSSAIRILDFLAGAVYALDGTMCKVSNGIFIASPKGCDVIGNQDDEDVDSLDSDEVLE